MERICVIFVCSKREVCLAVPLLFLRKETNTQDKYCDVPHFERGRNNIKAFTSNTSLSLNSSNAAQN
jgi:hypothetical protein